MTDDILQMLIGGISGRGLSVIYQKYMTDRKFESLAQTDQAIRDALSAHRLHTAENFATKTDMEKALEPVQRTLETISDKIDHLSGRLPPKPTRN